jgi:hypothetical protein
MRIASTTTKASKAGRRGIRVGAGTKVTLTRTAFQEKECQKRGRLSFTVLHFITQMRHCMLAKGGQENWIG